MRLRERAVFYWQDRLAKFFPASKGPTTCEIDMYKAGFREAIRLAAEVISEHAEGGNIEHYGNLDDKLRALAEGGE